MSLLQKLLLGCATIGSALADECLLKDLQKVPDLSCLLTTSAHTWNGVDSNIVQTNLLQKKIVFANDENPATVTFAVTSGNKAVVNSDQTAMEEPKTYDVVENEQKNGYIFQPGAADAAASGLVTTFRNSDDLLKDSNIACVKNGQTLTFTAKDSADNLVCTGNILAIDDMLYALKVDHADLKSKYEALKSEHEGLETRLVNEALNANVVTPKPSWPDFFKSREGIAILILYILIVCGIIYALLCKKNDDEEDDEDGEDGEE